MCVGFGCIYLPHAKSILLAVGLDDSSIALYSLTDFDQLTFVSLDVLKGHEDWVRGLDFISESEFRNIVAFIFISDSPLLI